MNLRFLIPLALGLAGLLGSQPAQAKIRVAASTTDLASIAASVGGDQVETFAIARPTADVHRVEVLPSYMVRVSRADVYLKVGLGLDQWADQIIDGSRNDRLTLVDCSRNIDALDKPSGKVDASMGDVHPNGNPHYWLDPRNGGIVARQIAEALGRIDPAHAQDYEGRAEAFAKEADEVASQGLRTLTSLPVHAILTYHSSWIYLAHTFGLEIVGTAEPVPGIPPTAKHLQELLLIVKQRKVPLFLQEPYFSDDAGSFLARETGLRIAKVSPSCDSGDAGSYLAHIRQVLGSISGSGGAVERSAQP